MPAKYEGFTLARVHDCKSALPGAYKFAGEHPGGVLMCNHCKTKWSVHGTESDGRWTYWWEPYMGAAE